MGVAMTARVWGEAPTNVPDPDVEYAHFVENAQHFAQGLVDRGYTNVALEVDGADIPVQRSQTPPAALEPTDEAALANEAKAAEASKEESKPTSKQ